MPRTDVVCLSHVPWAQALERPHQIMRRFARERRVFFVESKGIDDGTCRAVVTRDQGVEIVSFRLPAELDALAADVERRRMLATLARVTEWSAPLLWVYDPLATPSAQDVDPSLIVYDCIDDVSLRAGSPSRAHAAELALLGRADLVFTAGNGLFEAKRGRNVSTYPLPNSVEAVHFLPARIRSTRLFPRRRVGVLGPIDDRVDLRLVDDLARERPGLDVVLLGPLVDVAQTELPCRPNVRWLGDAAYDELPTHLADWDVGLVPWRSCDRTRLLSPSSALAYIAGGKPVVSTPLDELAPYVERGLVREATRSTFITAVDAALADAADLPRAAEQTAIADAVLARTSWDRTWNVMARLVGEADLARKLTTRARAGHVSRSA